MARIGKEIDAFIKTFLAVNRLGRQNALSDARMRYTDARTAKLNERGMSQEELDAHFRRHSGGGGGGGTGNAAAAGGGDVPIKDVYDAFRLAGFSDNQSRALVAEVGRENGLQSKFIYGTHNDPANGATNFGLLSFQGDRRPAVLAFLKKEGRLDENGRVIPGMDTLVAQARFIRNEMETNPAYARTKREFLGKPDIDPEQAAPILGRDYIRWRYDDPKYASHHQTRRNYLARVSTETPEPSPEGSPRQLAGAVPMPPTRPKTQSPTSAPTTTAQPPVKEEEPVKVPFSTPSASSPATPGNREGGTSTPSQLDTGQSNPTPSSSEGSGSTSSGDDMGALPLEEGTERYGEEQFAEGGMVGSMQQPDMQQPDMQQPDMQAVPMQAGSMQAGSMHEGETPDQEMAEHAIPQVPLGEVIDAALRSIQSSYNLGQENTALPGTDRARMQGEQDFANASGALSPAAYDELLDSVGGLDPGATALQQIYGFYSSKGDTEGAAAAAAGILQAARQRSMEFGQMAGDALDRRDFAGAAQALMDAYNEVPDGYRVTGEVSPEGVGRAIFTDANDQVVNEMELNPRMLASAASAVMAGDQFYRHLASLATQATASGARQPTQMRTASARSALPMKGYAGGGLVEDDEESFDEEKEFAGDGVEDYSAEADMPAAGAQEAQALSTTSSAGAAPSVIPYDPRMNAEQRKMVDTLNRRRFDEYRISVQNERAAQSRAATENRLDRRLEFQQRSQNQRMQYQQERENQRSERRNQLENQREQSRQAARERLQRWQEQQQNQRLQYTQNREDQREAARLESQKRQFAQQTHEKRMSDDPEYRMQYELQGVTRRQKELAGEERARQMSDDTLAGFDESQAAAELRRGQEQERNGLTGRALNITSKSIRNQNAADRDAYSTELQKLLNEGKEEVASGKVDASKLPQMDNNRKRMVLDVAESLGRLNSVSPDTIVRSIYGMAFKMDGEPAKVMPLTDKGVRIQYGPERFVMDEDTFRKIAFLRGEREHELAANKVAQEKKVQEQRSQDVIRREQVDERDEQRRRNMGGFYGTGTGERLNRTRREVALPMGE